MRHIIAMLDSPHRLANRLPVSSLLPAPGTDAGHSDDSACPKFDSWWARQPVCANLPALTTLDKAVVVEQEGSVKTPSTIEFAAIKEWFDFLVSYISLNRRADFPRVCTGKQVPKVRRAVREIF